MEPVTIEFILDGDAYARLMQRIFMKKALLWAVIILILVAVNAAINPERGLIWLGIFVLFATAWFVSFRIILKRTFKAATNLHDAVRYIFEETEVRVEAGEIKTAYQWTDFQKAVEMPEWFLLYQNKSVFNPVPKSAFGSELEIRQVRNLLMSKGLLAI
jgi:hypothetical protein